MINRLTKTTANTILTICITTALFASGCTLDEMAGNTGAFAGKMGGVTNYAASGSVEPLAPAKGKAGTKLKTSDDFYTVPRKPIRASASPVVPPDSQSTVIAHQQRLAKKGPAKVTELPAHLKKGKKGEPKLFSEVNLPQNITWALVEQNLTEQGYKIILRKPKTNRMFVLDTPSTDGVVQMKTPIYQIHFKSKAKDVTQLWITDNKKASLPKRVTTDMLKTMAGRSKPKQHHFAKHKGKTGKVKLTRVDRVKATKPLDELVTLEKPNKSEKKTLALADPTTESAIKANAHLADNLNPKPTT